MKKLFVCLFSVLFCLELFAADDPVVMTVNGKDILMSEFMYFFNRATGANYWFMAAPGTDSPFTGVYASSGFGGYLLAFLGVAAAISLMWYGLRYLLLVLRENGRPVP